MDSAPRGTLVSNNEVRNETSECPKPMASRISRRCLLTLYLECCSAPRRGLRRIENAAVGQLYCCWLKGRIGASLGRFVWVPITRGLAIMKIIIIVTAGLVGMLNVGAAV